MVTLHRLAKAYGCRPSELLSGTAADMQLDIMIFSAGTAREAWEAKKAAAAARKR